MDSEVNKMRIKESIEAIIEFFMKPDMKIMNDIDKLLECHQYEHCAEYIRALNQKTLKDALNYLIKKSKRNKTDSYAYKCNLYKVIFNENSKYYDYDLYNEIKNKPDSTCINPEATINALKQVLDFKHGR